METGKKLIHLSHDLSFVGEVHIVVRVRDPDHTRAGHAASKGICPGVTTSRISAIKAALGEGGRQESGPSCAGRHR